MSIATIITKYNNFTDKNLDGRNWFVCDHCHRIMAFGMPEADFAVSGFDDHGEAVDFCDIECAEKAGYEMCGDCNMWYLPSEMSDMKCSDGTPMCKSCAAKNKKDMEEKKMENKNVFYARVMLKVEVPDFDIKSLTSDANDDYWDWQDVINSAIANGNAHVDICGGMNLYDKNGTHVRECGI